MCLLDEVVQWDERSIVCISNTHRDPANPLRRQGRLSAVHAFEYGAQTAAVHGGLLCDDTGLGKTLQMIALIMLSRGGRMIFFFF